MCVNIYNIYVCVNVCVCAYLHTSASASARATCLFSSQSALFPTSVMTRWGLFVCVCACSAHLLTFSKVPLRVRSKTMRHPSAFLLGGCVFVCVCEEIRLVMSSLHLSLLSLHTHTHTPVVLPCQCLVAFLSRRVPYLNLDVLPTDLCGFETVFDACVCVCVCVCM